MSFTTIKKHIKEYSVLITDDPAELPNLPDMDILFKKNILRVYCVHGDKWATFLMANEMLVDIPKVDDFIYTMLQRQFDKIKPTD